MRQADRSSPPDHASPHQLVILRLLTGLVAFTAGVGALVIGLLLVQSTLG